MYGPGKVQNAVHQQVGERSDEVAHTGPRAENREDEQKQDQEAVPVQDRVVLVRQVARQQARKDFSAV